MNTSWSLEGPNGGEVSCFEGLSSLGVDHLKSTFKESKGTTIVEAIHVA